jgi:hypothetical protein
MRVSTRVSLWRANGMRCLYCGILVEFRDLEIDHLIPECTGNAEFEELRLTLGLGSDFHLDDTRNLVPTHHDCNRKKSSTRLNESNLRYFLGIWADKQERIREELLRFERAAERDDLLCKLSHQIESGGLSQNEISAFMRAVSAKSDRSAPSPIVLSFGTRCDERGVAKESQRTLIEILRREFKRPLILAEPMRFTGETLSLRLAIWHFDVERLSTLDLMGWELLEVDSASSLYGGDTAKALAAAIEDTYNIFHAEMHGCPECGGRVLMSGSASESGDFAIGTCETCGWENYYP